MAKKAKMQVTIQLDAEFVEKVDRMAERLGLSRSQMLRNLAVNGYDDAVILEKTGLFSAYKLGEKVVRKIKNGLVSGKYSLDQDGELKINEQADQSSQSAQSGSGSLRGTNRIGRLL